MQVAVLPTLATYLDETELPNQPPGENNAHPHTASDDLSVCDLGNESSNSTEYRTSHSSRAHSRLMQATSGSRKDHR